MLTSLLIRSTTAHGKPLGPIRPRQLTNHNYLFLLIF
jgi:hypothetical protein